MLVPIEAGCLFLSLPLIIITYFFFSEALSISKSSSSSPSPASTSTTSSSPPVPPSLGSFELARQILLSFIIKSVQHDKDPVTESKQENHSHSDNIENDSAIIKIHYGNEGKKDLPSESSGSEQARTTDVNTK
ncbi:hypothetical protein ACE6H2_010372 [Prunus campanulata]